MIKNFKVGTIGNFLLNHDNDYVFDLEQVFNKETNSLPSFSLVIPYFESWNTINISLEYALKSIEFVQKKFMDLDSEIIIVDDGSVKHPASKIIAKRFQRKIIILSLEKNVGRSLARNAGLKLAIKDIVGFMDSDIVCHPETIMTHLHIHQFLKNNKKNAVTFSLFNHLSMNDWQSCYKKDQLFNSSNDFRINCTYQSSWIGCDSDKQYVGKKYKIIEETDNLKKWPKNESFGPWILPNMILGGFFAVNREKAVSVGGFSSLFSKYGFTETPVSTKIIAKYQDYVIPVPYPYLIHLRDGGEALNQEKRNFYFQKAHDFYFNIYLNQNLLETIENEKL